MYAPSGLARGYKLLLEIASSCIGKEIKTKLSGVVETTILNVQGVLASCPGDWIANWGRAGGGVSLILWHGIRYHVVGRRKQPSIGGFCLLNEVTQ